MGSQGRIKSVVAGTIEASPCPHQLPLPDPQLLLFALSLQRALSDVQVGESQRSPRMTSPLAW